MKKVLGSIAAALAFVTAANAATLDFSSTLSGNSGLATLDVGDATVEVVGGTVFVFRPGDFGALTDSGGICAINTIAGCTSDWSLTFDYAVTNLMFEAAFFDAGDSVEVSYYNGATLLGSITVGANGVFSLGSAVVTSLFFNDSSAGGNGFGFGDFSFDRYVGVSDVPLPAALPLFLAGLGAGAFFRKRRNAA